MQPPAVAQIGRGLQRAETVGLVKLGELAGRFRTVERDRIAVQCIVRMVQEKTVFEGLDMEFAYLPATARDPFGEGLREVLHQARATAGWTASKAATCSRITSAK